MQALLTQATLISHGRLLWDTYLIPETLMELYCCAMHSFGHSYMAPKRTNSSRYSSTTTMRIYHCPHWFLLQERYGQDSLPNWSGSEDYEGWTRLGRHLKPAWASIFTPVPRSSGALNACIPLMVFFNPVLYSTYAYHPWQKSFRFCLDSILASPVTHSYRSGRPSTHTPPLS